MEKLFNKKSCSLSTEPRWAPGRKQKLQAFNPGCSFANPSLPTYSIKYHCVNVLNPDRWPNICMPFLLLIKRNKYILFIYLFIYFVKWVEVDTSLLFVPNLIYFAGFIKRHLLLLVWGLKPFDVVCYLCQVRWFIWIKSKVRSVFWSLNWARSQKWVFELSENPFVILFSLIEIWAEHLTNLQFLENWIEIFHELNVLCIIIYYLWIFID